MIYTLGRGGEREGGGRGGVALAEVEKRVLLLHTHRWLSGNGLSNAGDLGIASRVSHSSDV